MIEARLLARILGATFIGTGLLGFIPNPLVSPDGIFAVNTMHNLVHVLTGGAFLIGASMGKSRATVLGIGVGYVAVTLIGFLTKGHLMLGMVHINEADRWLHAGLAIAILASGYVSRERVAA